MQKKNFSRIQRIISSFDKAKVLVVGDLILDEFIWGDVSRISPEAPVPVETAPSTPVAVTNSLVN